METDFPFVQIAPELEPLIGTPDEGTHIYRKEGTQEESAAWFELLTEIIGPSVSPGGVGMYCPVSRAAVYKRIKEGKLSMFLFHVTHRKTTLFGTTKSLRQSPFAYIPVCEAKAWRRELEERAIRQGSIRQEELEGSRPDWHGEFTEWRNKKERAGQKEQRATDEVTVPDLVRALVKWVSSEKNLQPPTKTKRKLRK